ncbi:MAG TPA: hypothetical protein VGB45_15695 [Abditibacterium sp.]
MKNPWQWITEFAISAGSRGDFERLRLVEILEEAQSYPNEDPDARLALYQTGRELAAQLIEPWWVVVFEYWKSETLLYYKADPEGALQIAAKMVVETRKPIYAAQPERVGLSLNFIAAYSKIDPIGYEKPIRDAIAAGEGDWATFAGFHEVFWQLRTRFLTSIGDEAALEAAWEHLRVSENYHAQQRDSSAHYVIYALADLLTALWRFDRETARALTGELAQVGCELAPWSENERLGALFTMWRAVGERLVENEAVAARLYKTAQRKQIHLAPPHNALFAPALIFHEIADEREKMLEICDAASKVANAHALRFEEASWLLQKCGILAGMGRDFGTDADNLRLATAVLPSKNYWEAQLLELGAKN